MALNTYANLKASIESWSKRSDVSTSIDDFIDLAESEMWRHLELRSMEARATASLSTSSRYLALPDYFIKMRRFEVIVSSERYELEQVSPASLNVSTGTGAPCYFTITSQIEFDITPADDYTVEMQYYKSLTALSSSNTTNSVLTDYPSIYLFGSLWALYDWALNAEKAEYYNAKFMAAIGSANAKDKAGRFGAAPRMRLEGATP